MSQSRGIRVFSSGILLAVSLLLIVIWAGGYIGGNQAEANQPPPPPTYYTLTVNKSGGDSNCQVRITYPTTRSWTSTSDSASYVAGSVYEVEQQVNCPIFYDFSHWESNDEDLDGYQENHAPPTFTLTKNTTATAVFVPCCPGQMVIDMYENPTILGYDGFQYPNPPACMDLVTDLLCYEDLLFEDPGNFTYAELSCNHGDLPDEHVHWQWDNGVSTLFQSTRIVYGSSITVTCAYRCPRKNTDLNSKSTSAHPQGRAFDFDNNTNQSNWNIAVAASQVADTDRIFLYGGGPNGYRTYAWLVSNGYSGTSLPNDFTSGYTHGHADNQ